MAILASNNSTPRELIPAGNYLARCYQMIEIGTVEEIIMNVPKTLHKVRIGWELPTELKVFKEENGEQPLVISKEYTLSMHEKSNLRKDLKSWRGKDFTEDEAKRFDITALLGLPCMLNIIHKPSKSDASKVYQEIAGITSIPKGFSVPKPINPVVVLSYDKFDNEVFEKLPDFIKNKMKSSQEYAKMMNPEHRPMPEDYDEVEVETVDDLPF
jgi:hypothetical protein